MHQLLQWTQSWPPEWAVFILSALPVAELRGGIPLGYALGLSPMLTLGLAVLGNLLPAIPLLLLLDPISEKLRHIPVFRRFFDWLYARSKAKGGLIEKYEAIGLMIFVAIPLPMTGLWTGAIAASIFKIRFRWAMMALVGGVVISAVIVSILCYSGKMVLNAM